MPPERAIAMGPPPFDRNWKASAAVAVAGAVTVAVAVAAVAVAVVAILEHLGPRRGHLGLS